MPSVTSFTKTNVGRSWTMTDSGQWECTEIWQAEFDGDIDDPLAFYGSVLLPAIGEQHPDQPLLRLKSVPNGIPPIDKALRAINFTLVWTTSRLPETQHDPNRYEDSLRATKSWSHRVIQEPVHRAYVSDDGGSTFSASPQPIANTVGDLFIPGITRNRYLQVCRYVRNELAVPTSVLDLPGTMNNDTFTLDGKTVTANQALIVAAPVSAPKRFESYTFRTIEYEIMIRPEGWDEDLLNKGFYYLQPGALLGTNVKRRITLPDGEDTDGNKQVWKFAEEPVVLNIDSRHKAELEFLGVTDPFVPHFRRFRYLNRVSFGAMGFT